MTTLLTGGGTRSREALDDDVDLARDRVLVTRAQGGDRGAFDDLYVRYYRRLYRFCLRRLHDGYEAEDVAQEAFARAWRALPTFAGDRRFYPWLSVIAAHLCTDVLRRRNRSTPVAEFHQGNVASTDDGGEELMLSAVDSELVSRAFRRLSDRHQRILHLREGSGWSYQRIADHEGVGITAVETLLWRARQALKREFAALAGTEGRTAAWLGGLFTMAALRRVLRLPMHGARRGAQLAAHSGATLAMGSAAAATAMVVAAALGGPLHSSPSTGIGPSGGSSGGVSAASAPPWVVPGANPGGASPQPAGAASSGATGGTAASPVNTRMLNGSTGALSATGAALGGSAPLGGTVSGVSSTVQGVTGTAGNLLGGITGSLEPTISTNAGTLSQTASGTAGAVAGTVQGTLGTASGATGISLPSTCTTVLGVSTC